MALGAALGLSLALSGVARADDFTWTGNTSDEWTNGGNWTKTTNTVPARLFPNSISDTALFDNAIRPDVTIGSAISVNKITVGLNSSDRSLFGAQVTIGGAAAALDVAAAKSLTLNNVLAGTAAAGNVIFVKASAGVLTLTGANTFTGTLSLNAGTLTAANAGVTNGATNNPLGTSVISLNNGATNVILQLRSDGAGGTGAETVNFGNVFNVLNTSSTALQAPRPSMWAV